MVTNQRYKGKRTMFGFDFWTVSRQYAEVQTVLLSSAVERIGDGQ